jgi:predicted nuclease of predicted toxin-antitoxin system
MNKGFPPKVIIIRINNMNTNNLLAILQNYTSTIQTFIQNQESGILEIY